MWDRQVESFHTGSGGRIILKIYYELNRETAVKSQKKVLSLDIGLWSSNCTKKLYIYKGRGGSGSSLFEQNTDFVRKKYKKLGSRGDKELAETWFERSSLIKTRIIKCYSLDYLIFNKFKNKVPYGLLKVDSQGAEYNILKGSERLLNSTLIALYLELFNIPIYKNITPKNEVVKYLKGFSFNLIKEFPYHGSFNSQQDCLFLKSNIDFRYRKIFEQVYKLK
jgi:hypothetical protein